MSLSKCGLQLVRGRRQPERQLCRQRLRRRTDVRGEGSRDDQFDNRLYVAEQRLQQPLRQGLVSSRFLVAAQQLGGATSTATRSWLRFTAAATHNPS